VPAYWLAGLLALGLGLRIAVVATHSSELSTDRDAYLGIAQGVWEGRGFSVPGSRQPTAYRPPLYPLFLAPISAADQAWLRGAVQVLLGTATVALTWIAARRSDFDLRSSVIATGLVAVDPLLLVYTPQIMTEALAVFLTAAALAGLAGRSPGGQGPAAGWSAGRQIGIGIVLGLACLCRPTFFPWAALLGAWFAARGLTERSLSWGTRLRRLPWLVIIALVATVAPWPLRNQLRFGKPILTTTHGGYTLLLSNNERYYEDVVRPRASGVWSGPRLEQWQREIADAMARQGIMGEIAQDRWMMEAGKTWIAAHPREFFEGAIERIKAFWRLGPATTAGKWISLVAKVVRLFYAALWILAAVGLAVVIRRKSLDAVPGLLLILVFAGAHAIYFTNARMRAPLVPSLALLAATGVSLAWRRSEFPATQTS